MGGGGESLLRGLSVREWADEWGLSRRLREQPYTAWHLRKQANQSTNQPNKIPTQRRMLWRGEIKAVVVGRVEVVIEVGKIPVVPGALNFFHCLTVICSFLPPGRLPSLPWIPWIPLPWIFIWLTLIHPQGPAYTSLLQGSLPWPRKFGIGNVPLDSESLLYFFSYT